MKQKILIADDNDQMRKLLEVSLGASGYQVSSAHDGVDAMARAHAEAPDLVVLDIQMPLLDGFATLRQFRADPELSHVPVIAITASTNPETHEKAIGAGFASYLAKPVNRLSLLAEIERLLPKN